MNALGPPVAGAAAYNVMGNNIGSGEVQKWLCDLKLLSSRNRTYLQRQTAAQELLAAAADFPTASRMCLHHGGKFLEQLLNTLRAMEDNPMPYALLLESLVKTAADLSQYKEQQPAGAWLFMP
jgi:hypothetical protein